MSSILSFTILIIVDGVLYLHTPVSTIKSTFSFNSSFISSAEVGGSSPLKFALVAVNGTRR